MFQTKLGRHGLRSALLLGAASSAAVALTYPALAQEQSVETVVVTGSRIPQQGLYASSPVTAVGQQELKLEGTTSVETLLNNLPSVVADFTQTASNGATGQATVDLRGLGAQRTLVLVNGTRLMPSDPANPVADLNQIPAALVDHVEVLTGGASAVYGSDAEAGVVNFVMRKDFEGVELDGQYTINQAGNGNQQYIDLQNKAGFANAPKDWWGGDTVDSTLIVGTNTADGKGNVTAYIGYRNSQPVLEAKRDFSACSISVVPTGDNPDPGTHVCSGSSNYDRFISIDNLANGLDRSDWDNFLTGNGNPGSGLFVPYTGSPDQKFNYGPLNYLQRPDTRYVGGYYAHYEVNKAIDIYSNFMFSDDHTLAQIAPSGIFLGSGTNNGLQNINCSNPLMTAQERHQLCGLLPGDMGDNGAGNLVPGQALLEIGRRDIEGGNRVDDLRHTAYRMVVGARGDLGSGWSYDVYGQYGLTLFSENYNNEFSKQRVQNALEVDPATGKCFAAEADSNGIIADPRCVPLNIFNGFGGITQDALNYVQAQGFQQGYTEEQVLSGSLTGDLGAYGIQSPWAKSPVAVSIGGEYRQEGIKLDTSRDFQINDLYGQGSATLPVPLSRFDVKEGFGEVRIPLAQGLPFVEDLSVNGGYRYSDYSSVGGVSAYKIGAEWQPVDDFRFRASYQRAVRAPNVLESFSPNNVVLFGGQDPCAGSSPSATLAQCEKSGVTPAEYGKVLSCPASQCNHLVGGNPNLSPETSFTKSIGIVLTPTFFDGFNATVDYFDIKVGNYISSLDSNVVLGNCINPGPNVSEAVSLAYCGFIHRDSIGTIASTNGYVDAVTRNLGFLRTRGLDFEANYQADMADWGISGWGSLAFNFVGTWTQDLTTEPASGDLFVGTYNCAGTYGQVCGTPTPRWRHKLRTTWATPWDVDLSVDWRHLSGNKLDLNKLQNPLLSGGCGASSLPCPDVVDGHIAAYDYFDLAANWTVRQGVELRAGVDNVFDKTPPVLDSNNYAISAPAFGNGNTYPGVYDSLGRTIFVGATLKY